MDSGAMEIAKILKISMLSHGPQPSLPDRVFGRPNHVFACIWTSKPCPNHVFGRPKHVLGRPNHVFGCQNHVLGRPNHAFGCFACFGAWRARPGVALPGFEGDDRGGPRLANSFRALETAVWQRLDAALTGSRSYFGALVPAGKSDFWRPGTHFWPTRPTPARRI